MMEIIIDRKKWDELTSDEKFKNANRNMVNAEHFESSLLTVIGERNLLKKELRELKESITGNPEELRFIELSKLVSSNFDITISSAQKVVKKFVDKLINTFNENGSLSLENIGSFGVRTTQTRNVFFEGKMIDIKPYRAITYSKMKPIKSSISFGKKQEFILDLIRDPRYKSISFGGFGKFTKTEHEYEISFKASYALKNLIKKGKKDEER